jgi:cytochrome c biogenesis protein CcmG/thiol:disulfide interchange protein DsbE
MLVPLVAQLAASFGNNPRELPSVLEQKAAPTFVLTDLSGKTWSLEALRGKPVVVNFWATWCKECKKEHATLGAAPARYPQVQFLGVLYADDPVKARAHLKGEAAYPTLIDANGHVAIDYGITGVPETLFISKEGVLFRKVVGPLDNARLDAFLAPLLDSQS